MEKKLDEFFSRYHLFEGNQLSPEQHQEMVKALELEYQAWFLSAIIEEIEEIMSIPASLSIREILEVAARRIVTYLHAAAATIRLLDPESMRMTSFGAFGVEESARIGSIPLNDSISGKVARERKALAIPNILEHPLYKDKGSIRSRGYYSLLAVPLFNPLPGKESASDLFGTLQIYYSEKDRQFNNLEIIHAELLARRVSFVLAKKKILDLQEFNRRKETIVNKIFVKLSRREGIKLKDLFLQMIPDLKELLQVQGCSLFTVSDDQRHIHLEAVFPPEAASHDTNHNYTVENHPYFKVPIFESHLPRESDCDKITHAYTLIRNPLCSSLMTLHMKDFCDRHHIHSILLVPLKVAGQVRHLLTFYATEKRKEFSEDEIELLTFLGKEIIKACKLEFLDDVLHDIKNPTVAVAGFARRALKLMEKEDSPENRAKLVSYLEIISSEANRMQDLAQTMSGVGREELIDLSAMAGARFKIAAEVVAEGKMKHVELRQPKLEEDLLVFCPRFGLERVLDNLLGNGVKAVPDSGGYLTLRTFSAKNDAILVVENSGEISASHLADVRAGKVKGRGLNIISRFVHSNHGHMEVEAIDGTTRFTITLPKGGAE